MKAIVDTNILISYLLQIESPSPPSSIVRAALAGQFQIVSPQDTIDELRRAFASKPYLATRVSKKTVEEFVDLLADGARFLPKSNESLPQVTRDPGDDYLIAHAVLEQVDYLVTGDKDLLVLGEIAGVRIVSPTEFVAILDAPDATDHPS